MFSQLPASVSPLDAGLSLKGVMCRNRGWFCQRVEAKSCLEAWTGSAPAGDSLQALDESFPASLLGPLEAVGRPRRNVLGIRDCEPEADNAGPATCPAHCLSLLLLLPSFIHVADTMSDAFARYLLRCCYCFAERGPCSIAQVGLKPKVILLPQAPESCPGFTGVCYLACL